MPKVMAALPNTGGAICSTPQSLADAHCWSVLWVPCSNAAKTRNPLKFAGVPKTTGLISAASGPKFTVWWGYVEEILLLNKFFFSDCWYMPDKVVRWCPDGKFLTIFLHPVFAVSRVQHVSDLHLKFALRPHHVWKYHRHPICNSWD